MRLVAKLPNGQVFVYGNVKNVSATPLGAYFNLYIETLTGDPVKISGAENWALFNPNGMLIYATNEEAGEE